MFRYDVELAGDKPAARLRAPENAEQVPLCYADSVPKLWFTILLQRILHVRSVGDNYFSGSSYAGRCRLFNRPAIAPRGFPMGTPGDQVRIFGKEGVLRWAVGGDPFCM